MYVSILTLFPDLFPGPLGASITGRALDDKKWDLDVINIRDFATDTHKTVDDTPYGGGAGMVMKADIIGDAFTSIKTPGRRIYLSPRGKTLDQSLVKELSQEPALTLLCGRYEGVDQRFLDAYDFEEISIGDYVLTGGEMAAHILLDATVRLLPGVLGNDDTAGDESFENGLLEYPHYTRPAVWKDITGQDHSVPDILTSGNHKKIDEWRREQAENITKTRRPDLFNEYLAKK